MLKPTPVYPLPNGIYERSQMEFRWNMPAQATAFELVIKNNAGTVVYSSGVRPPPNRRREIHNSQIYTCAFTPEIYANQLTGGATYNWQVHVFTPVRDSSGKIQHGMRSGGDVISANSSTAQNFSVSTKIGQYAGAFNINVDLAFFTPNSGSPSVIVEAYKNAAFSGTPSARTIINSIGSGRPAYPSATLYGLTSKQGYYIRAYVRANSGDSMLQYRKLYDPWGYVYASDPNGLLLYDPQRVTDTQFVSTYWLPMYATDINNNRLADISESFYISTLGFSFDSEEFTMLLGMYNGDETDTTGSGVPDSLENAIGLDGSSAGSAPSSALLNELGVSNPNDLVLMISGMPTTPGGGMSLEWALGTMEEEGGGAGWQPMGHGGGKKHFKPSNREKLETKAWFCVWHTEKLGAEADWHELPQYRAKASKTSSSITLPIDPAKSSGFYQIRLVELKK